MKRAVSILLCAAFITVFFCGCSLRMVSVTSLMRPPVAEEDELLLDAIDKLLGKSIMFKSPAVGDFHSSIIRRDIDFDGDDEVLVFYTTDENSSAARMSILEEADGEWLLVSDFSGGGSGVNSVSFSDLNYDGCEDILVSWTLFDNKVNKVLSIYNCVSDESHIKVNVAATEPFNLMQVIDLFDDSNTEILLVYLNIGKEIPVASARLLTMKADGTVSLLSETSLDSNISSYSSIKTDRLAAKSPLRIYIDANKGNTQMITEVLTWDSGMNNFSTPYLDKLTLANTATLRPNTLQAQDINNDSIIEIPGNVLLPGSNRDTASTREVFLEKWSSVSGSSLVPVEYHAINPTDGYRFSFPVKWINKVTIVHDISQRTWSFYKYKLGSDSLGDKLMTVFCDSIDDLDKIQSSGNYILSVGASNVISCEIYDAGESFGLTRSLVFENFELTSK